MQQFGASFGELMILPPTPTEPHPPFPAEVDDAYIFPAYVGQQPEGIVSIISGFLANVHVYTSYSTLSTMEMAFGIGELYDWERQKRILDFSLRTCKRVLDGLPEVLKVLPQDSRDGRFGQRKQPYYPPMPEYMAVRDPALPAYDTENSPEARRQAQFEIQKANIYGSHLSTRSYLVEKYFTLLDTYNKLKAQRSIHSSPGALAAGLDTILLHQAGDYDILEQDMANERENVVKDLLVVLGSIDLVNMEPNADSFVSSLTVLLMFTMLELIYI